jgi:PTH1 family peptidyl-tRNA hydrolase
MDIKYIFIKTKEDNTDCMNIFNSRIRNIGAEYVNTRHNIGFQNIGLFCQKEQLSFQTVKLCPCRIQI